MISVNGKRMLAIKAVLLGPRCLMMKHDKGEDRKVTLWRIEATSARVRVMNKQSMHNKDS